ncbi:uncharacterized protein zgc:193726 isoform X1 [Xyrauchen texanus]|uniref:uncharacterized protein zgc:193726 isoform X1 n=1 Tax=Xyrauchen texanus TaxID=154827 RepID=UPI00224294DB|nr:uncharacterized protein zgc:193726 isoform X1 [Xyrauchen texanus]
MVYVLKSNSQLLHSDSLFSVIQSLCVMDSMFPAWALTALLLSYTLGVPIQNSTSGPNLEYFLNDTVTNSSVSGSDKESSLNATEIDQIGNANNYNSTVPLNRTSGRQKASQRFCLLSTCALSKLGYSLQRGDETAGNMSDPMGIGKK